MKLETYSRLIQICRIINFALVTLVYAAVFACLIMTFSGCEDQRQDDRFCRVIKVNYDELACEVNGAYPCTVLRREWATCQKAGQ